MGNTKKEEEVEKEKEIICDVEKKEKIEEADNAIDGEDNKNDATRSAYVPPVTRTKKQPRPSSRDATRRLMEQSSSTLSNDATTTKETKKNTTLKKIKKKKKKKKKK